MMAEREINQHQRNHGADALEERLGHARSLQEEPDHRDETDENGDAGEQTLLKLLRRYLEQGRVTISQSFPRRQSEDDGDKIAERRENKEVRVTLGRLKITGNGEPDEESDVHAGVIPEKSSFTSRVVRSEPLGQHHIYAGNIEPAPGQKKSEADIKERECAGGDAATADYLQCHAADEEIAIRKETAAEITTEEVQAVIESAEP